MLNDGFSPIASQLGLVSKVGPVPPRSAFPKGSLRGAERPLLHQFIGTQYLSFSSRSIMTPGTWSGATAPATGQSVWYGLASWTVPEDIGSQGALVGYRVELGPTNPTNNDPQITSGAGAKAWGHAAGYGGAIVVGVNLPVQLGAWNNGSGNVPLVEAPSTSASNVSQFNGSPYTAFHFAPGTLGDTSVQTVYRLNQTTPLAVLLTQGTRLDVAFVLNGTDARAIGGAAAPIPMRVYGELIVAQAITRGQYSE